MRSATATLHYDNGMFLFKGKLAGIPIGWTEYAPEHFCTTDITLAKKQMLAAGGEEAIRDAENHYRERSVFSRKDTSDFNPKKPSLLDYDYFPFQKAGVHYLLTCRRALLADEQGLGKTIQAIGLMNELKPRKVLIICPASLKTNWEIELKTWLAYWATVGTVYSNKWVDANITIINYDIAVKNYKKLHGQIWDLVIMDEVHYLKNPDSQRTQAILGSARKKPIQAERVIAITGTPVPNRPIEMYNILKFLDPYGWESRKRYADRYCQGYTDRWGRRDESGASNLSELNIRIRGTLMIRRLKEDVLRDLPEKMRTVIPLDITNTNRKKINKLSKELLKASGGSFHEGDYASIINSMKAGGASTGETLGEMAELRRLLGESKVAPACEYIRAVVDAGNKVVVFAHHKTVIEHLCKEFKHQQVCINGATPVHTRSEVVRQFQENEDIRVFIGNIQAAGVGITLTAASEIIFVEGDWVPGNLSQAEDRCHRISQTETLFVQHLVVEDTLDAIMARAIIRKQKNISNVVDKEI